MYIGNAFVSQLFVISLAHKIIISILLWIFSIVMIYKYAPADTEEIPVVSKKERRKRKYYSYVIVTIMLILGCLIRHNITSNIIIVGILLQSVSISRLAYKITNNKYGHEEYWKNKNIVVN